MFKECKCGAGVYCDECGKYMGKNGYDTAYSVMSSSDSVRSHYCGEECLKKGLK